MEKITMGEAETNYGACSLLVLIASGTSAWFGFQLAFAQMASVFNNALTHQSTNDSNYGIAGLSLILVAFLTLIWAIALAGAGFAVNRGRVFSLLTIGIILSPLFYILIQFFTGIIAAQPISLF